MFDFCCAESHIAQITDSTVEEMERIGTSRDRSRQVRIGEDRVKLSNRAVGGIARGNGRYK